MHPEMSVLKAYTSPREFSGFQIPVSLQSLAIRRYSEENGLLFSHHVSENITRNTYLVLERVVSEAKPFQAIGMCSVGLLPANPIQRNALLRSCMAKRVSVHFVFEQITLNSVAQLDSLAELMSLATLLSNQSNHLRQVGDLLKGLTRT